MERIARLHKSLVQPRNPFAKLPLDGQLARNDLCFTLDSIGIQSLTLAEHRLRDLGGYDRSHLAEIRSYCFNLARRNPQELEIALQTPGNDVGTKLLPSIACTHRM